MQIVRLLWVGSRWGTHPGGSTGIRDDSLAGDNYASAPR